MERKTGVQVLADKLRECANSQLPLFVSRKTMRKLLTPLPGVADTLERIDHDRISALNGISRERARYKAAEEALADLTERVKELKAKYAALEEKHWDECRMMSKYDAENFALKKAVERHESVARDRVTSVPEEK